MRTKASLKYTGKLAFSGFLILFFFVGLMILMAFGTNIISVDKSFVRAVGLEMIFCFIIMIICKEIFFDGIKFMKSFNIGKEAYLKGALITIIVSILFALLINFILIYFFEGSTMLDYIHYNYKNVLIGFGGSLNGETLERLPLMVNITWLFLINMISVFFGLFFAIFSLSEKTTKKAVMLLGSLIIFIVFNFRSKVGFSILKILTLPLINNYFVFSIIIIIFSALLYRSFKKKFYEIEI